MNSICSNFETVFGTNENSMDTGSSEPSSQETDLFSLIKSGNINGSVTTSVTILLFPTNSSYKQIVLVVDGNVVASVVVDVVVGEVFVDVEYVSGFVVVVDKGEDVVAAEVSALGKNSLNKMWVIRGEFEMEPKNKNDDSCC